MSFEEAIGSLKSHEEKNGDREARRKEKALLAHKVKERQQEDVDVAEVKEVTMKTRRGLAIKLSVFLVIDMGMGI